MGMTPIFWGEWELIAAFQDFPNLEKMEQHYQRAKRLMTAPSVIFTVGETVFVRQYFHVAVVLYKAG